MASWLPNQMSSLILILGFLCRSSIIIYYYILVPRWPRNIAQQCAKFSLAVDEVLHLLLGHGHQHSMAPNVGAMTAPSRGSLWYPEWITTMDNNGQLSAVLHASLMSFCLLIWSSPTSFNFDRQHCDFLVWNCAQCLEDDLWLMTREASPCQHSCKNISTRRLFSEIVSESWFSK